MSDQLNIGVVGAGGFASWAALAFLKIPGVVIKAVSDKDEKNAVSLANEFNAKVIDFSSLCAASDIDLVYIGTPPHLHYTQSLQALEAEIVDRVQAVVLYGNSPVNSPIPNQSHLSITSFLTKYLSPDVILNT